MAFSGAGTGVLGDPYQITTWAQFKEIINEPAAHYLMMNDVNGANTAFGTLASFTGVLDGGNYELSNVASTSLVMLFTCNEPAIVKNIKLKTALNSANVFGTTNTNTGATFENITLTQSSTLNYASVFAGRLVNCTLNNITHNANNGTGNLANYISGGVFTNVIVKSNNKVEFGGSVSGGQYLCTGTTFNNCKFVVLHSSNQVYSLIPKSCTFNNCLFYGGLITAGTNNSALTKNIFYRTSFIYNKVLAKTGTLSPNFWLLAYTNATFTQCYFGGSITYNHTSCTNGTFYKYRLAHFEYFVELIDCLFEIDLTVTWINTTPVPYNISPYNNTGNNIGPVRCFFNNQIIGFDGTTGDAVQNGTDCKVNSDGILPDPVTKTANFTLLTSEQTKAQANFSNYDFVSTWQINEGVSSPKLQNVIYDIEEFLPDFIITSVSLSRINTLTEKISIITPREVSQSAALKCYVSDTLDGLENPINLTAPPVKINDNLYEAVAEVSEGVYYVLVVFEYGEYRNEKAASSFHYSVDQIDTTVLNIPTTDFHITNPALPYMHGSCYYNGHVYGTARGSGSVSIVKLNTNDYTQALYNTFYKNKIALFDQLDSLEQIVYCQGYLWALSGGIIIRINPGDLDYIAFNSGLIAGGLPIGADENYLYIGDYLQGLNNKIYKVDVQTLLGDFASYNYTDYMVPLPSNSIIGSCFVIPPQNVIDAVNPYFGLLPSYHAMIVDSNYIYLSVTSSNYVNGIMDNEAHTNVCYLVKINKHTMTEVYKVPIPVSTDDMTQNEEYVFLVPELIQGALGFDYLGKEWGLYAVKKSNLQIKYLKALHKDYHLVAETERAGHGVQYFGQHMAVQLINSKKTFIINTQNIANWGVDFPVGGATVAIYSFEFNGVPAAYPSNELITAQDGSIHANTWQAQTTIYKFTDSGIVLQNPPVVQTVLIQSLINSTTIGGEILSPGSSDVTMVGLRYGTVSTNLDQIISFENPSINFQSVLNLAPGIYYFQAYAANSVGTSYGAIVPFVVGNTVILSHDSAGAAASLRNNNSGHAVRFCKRAWGVADGTIGSATDADGNVYKTIVINEIEWAAADLKTALYNNDDDIPLIENNTQWSEATAGARTYYNNILPT